MDVIGIYYIVGEAKRSSVRGELPAGFATDTAFVCCGAFAVQYIFLHISSKYGSQGNDTDLLGEFRAVLAAAWRPP